MLNEVPLFYDLMRIYQILPISLIFLLVICVPCPRSYCSLCHVNLYVLLLLLLLLLPGADKVYQVYVPREWPAFLMKRERDLPRMHRQRYISKEGGIVILSNFLTAHQHNIRLLTEGRHRFVLGRVFFGVQVLPVAYKTRWSLVEVVGLGAWSSWLRPRHTSFNLHVEFEDTLRRHITSWLLLHLLWLERDTER